MSKLASWIGFLVLFVAGLAVVYLFGGSRMPQGEDPSLASRLQAELNGGASAIDFDELVPGTWERMHVFAPYTAEAQVTRALGKPWPHFDQSGIDSSDSFCLVVFERNGEVVSWYRQIRIVDLEATTARSPFMRDGARFDVVRRANGTDWQLVVADD